MKLKKENRLHRCNINRPRSRHGHKYNKYKTCLSMIMPMCNTETTFGPQFMKKFSNTEAFKCT